MGHGKDKDVEVILYVKETKEVIHHANARRV